ncbi:hypothetical protein B0I35DRAFT_84744 [Stachybotrys elegans]|uniref:Uncharacterized protein n=1 Tax=Stachybotrys elegans TaxID=80388 RepID=A0A8K0SHP7_9HYPO|nr:hypothetical protein B0I35DRAFT_84744 [Stachybotrys elegans]
MDPQGAPYPIYLGVWTNRSYGRVFGSTLTLTRSDGALLIAFLAFFVTVVGTQVWRIICFSLFHIYSNSTRQDALYNQRQAILRNTASPIGGVLILLQMVHAWAMPNNKLPKAMSHPQARPLARLVPLLVGAFVIAVSLTAASGLSSQIARGNEVVIDGSRCGLVRQDRFIGSSASSTLYDPYRRRQTEQAAEYAQRCYESNSISDYCSTFVRSALPMKTITNASCPFDESLCLSQDSNIIVESGPIDSQEDLGLNWGEDSKFQLSHRLHCAPLVTSNYTATYIYDNVTYESYTYGEAFIPQSDCNCTVAVNTESLTSRFKSHDAPIFAPTQDYNLMSVWAQFRGGSFWPDWSLFSPIDGLRGHNGDLSLTFLFPNEVIFTSASEDIWYRATVPTRRIHVTAEAQDTPSEYEVYASDEAAWPMGCVEQFELCRYGICTGLGSRGDTVQGIVRHLNLSSDFLGLAAYIDLMNHPSNVITALGKESLASRYKTADATQSGAGVNEWHLDVIHWAATILSGLQFQLTELASGPSLTNPQLEEYVAHPNATEWQQYCGSQKIRSTAYQSFSMFGLLFTLVAGVIIILISASLDSLATFIQRRFSSKLGVYSRIEWRANHALHLQRLALGESDSLAEWQLGCWNVPITKGKSSLAVLDTTDPAGLPRLSRAADEKHATREQARYGSAITTGLGIEEGQDGLTRITIVTHGKGAADSSPCISPLSSSTSVRCASMSDEDKTITAQTTAEAVHGREEQYDPKTTC